MLNKKLYELHTAYSKHTGTPVPQTGAESEQGLYGPLYYCAECQGFYVDDHGTQYAVAKRDNRITQTLLPWLPQWTEYAAYIGQAKPKAPKCKSYPKTES
jgi:hypothetical protein